MTDHASNDYDIETIKRIFFDPQCGGSARAKEAVDKLIEGYRASFQFLNSVLPASAQHEIESESDAWIKPEQMERQIASLLSVVHTSDASRQRFREAAPAMGIAIPYERGMDREDCETDFRANLADVLAQHYAANVMIARAVARGASA